MNCPDLTICKHCISKLYTHEILCIFFLKQTHYKSFDYVKTNWVFLKLHLEKKKLQNQTIHDLQQCSRALQPSEELHESFLSFLNGKIMFFPR